MREYSYQVQQQVRRQATLYFEEVASGVFNTVKDKVGRNNVLVSSEDVVNSFNNKEKVVLEAKGRILANFEVEFGD